MVFNSILTITTVVLNCCIVVAFWRSPRLKGKVYFFLIMLLCLVDIAVGLFSNSIFVTELATELSGTIDCWLRLLGVESNILLTNVSLLTATTINIERYLAIVHPIFHKSKITRRKFMVFIILLGLHVQ